MRFAARLFVVVLTFGLAFGPSVRGAARPQLETLDADLAAGLERKLSGRITAEDAVQIALAMNPGFLATLQEVGIARGVLRQASLLQNPVASARAGRTNIVRKPDSTVDLLEDHEFTLAENLLDVVLRPLRRKVAQEQLEEARLRAGDAAIKLTADVTSAYWTLVGAQESFALSRWASDSFETAAELSRRQREAGNINELELTNQQAAYELSRVELTRADAELGVAREALARLMGVPDRSASLEVTGALRALPRQDPPLDATEKLAIDRRLDLAAARREIVVVDRTLALTRASTLREVNVGVFTEQDPDGFKVTGPSVSVDLPIFDRQQGKKAELRARLKQTGRLAEDLEVSIRSEVRTAYRRLVAARTLVAALSERLIPLRQKVEVLSQQQYNFTLIGVFQLLEAKRSEWEARRDHIRATTDYWLAWTALERAAGGELPAEVKSR